MQVPSLLYEDYEEIVKSGAERAKPHLTCSLVVDY